MEHMNRMLKRMSIAVLLMFLCITVQAATKTYEYHGIFYQLYNDNPYEVMVVNPNNSSYAGAITIPDSIKYKGEEEGDSIKASVVAINEWAFQNCQLTTLTFPASISKIGKSAFYNCAIDTLILDSWKQLCEDIDFDNADANPLRKAGHFCFSSDTENEITVWAPEGITKINPYVFSDFKKMTSVTLPNTLTEIGTYAFSGCTGLTEISIPASVNSIGSKAFEGCTGMRNKKVTFASKEALCQITFGDRYANPLYYAHHLYYQNDTKEITGLVLSDNVTAISASAFAGGENIITVTIPANIQQFGADAFLDCKSLQSVSYASTEHFINMNYDNEYASPLKYAKNVTITGGSIATITINQDIKDNLFANAVGLNQVIIGSGCKTIGKAAFKGCEYLSEVTIEEGVETIDNDAFKDCKNLVNITLPASLKKIGSQAFYSCYKLKSITIPAGVETMFQEIFMHCTGLESVTIGTTHIEGIPDRCFYSCTALKNVQLSNTITTIARESFRKCSSLTALPTGSQLQSISNNAFAECNGIQTLDLPSSVLNIAPNAFTDCKGLTQLIINIASTDRLQIGNGAFAGCDKLGTIFTHASPAPNASSESFGGKKDIQLYYDNGATGYDVLPWSQFTNPPATITQRTITYKVDGKIDSIDTYNIGEYVTPYTVTPREGWDFSGWQEDIPDVMPDGNLVINGYFTTKRQVGGLYYHLDPNTAKATVIYHDSYKELKSIEIPATVTFVSEYYENSTYNVVAIADTAFVKCNKMEELTIPNSVTSIGRGAFKECTELYKKVTLPAGVTELSDSLFYKCKNLTEIEMGAVIKIGASSFNECTNLSLSTLPATVQEIGSLAFCNCKVNLTEFTIPASVTKFADRVFLGCESLEEVTFETSQLDTLPAYTFQNCYKLKKFTLDPKTKLIEEGAFMNCRSLDVLTLPENTIIDRIKEKAFIGCSGLIQIRIPASVKFLGGQAFKGCTNLRYVIMDASEAPSALKTLFDNEIYTTDTLYIPTGAQAAYSAKEPWSLFTKKVARVNHNLMYMVDGVQYGDTQTLITGASIDLKPEAAKPGHEFSGWQNVPAYQIMPDEDVTITGAFKYAITYKDAENSKELYKDSLWYGDKIVAPVELDSMSHIYHLAPELALMPAKDTTITVTYEASETEYVSDGIRYYIYTQGENAHAEIMPGQTPYTNKTINIPRSVSYQDNNFKVTVIRNDAFKDCQNLEDVLFESPSNIQQIGSQAFYNCNKLTDIDIPKSVTELGDGAFRYCTSLGEVTFGEGSTLQLLPASIFLNCSALTDIILPTSLTTIANDAFNGCEKLTSIIIPENVSNIGLRAFKGCTKLEEITVNATTMPDADITTFDNSHYAATGATLIILPSIDINNLQEPWSEFENISQGGSTVNQCASPTIRYNKGVLTYACETPNATVTSIITVADAKKSNTESVTLDKVYTITATARANGFAKSQPTIATITWRNGKPLFSENITVVSQDDAVNPGDVNEDGVVNIADVTAVINIINQ